MSKYQEQVRRSAAQANYWRDYRYVHKKREALKSRGTLLDFKNDIMPLSDEELNNSFFDSDASESSEWLRRYIDYYIQKETGRGIYTMPKPDRYKAVQAFVEGNGFLPRITLFDHSESAYAAALVASAKGYDCYADERLLAGTFRGTFLGASLNAEDLCEYVLQCHFIPDEQYFRIRLFGALYQRRRGEDDEGLVQRSKSMGWDSWSMRDGFASFATNLGALFFLDGEKGGTSGYDANGFAFDNTGRRALGFTATPQDEAGNLVRFQLCRQPDDIDRYLDILHRISAELS
ncbi:hypothetical protein [uncultured Sneathiella sp.]|jgi:hypothetical protein|uniref:hypothetical protein n=1 Tax=uncultured Sneathiella sp. TaxID=879315 RepID=UPI0030D9925A|tara:strand:- start:444 stop:1313 length:870 start_codon:yes stop_codon:yes gene_type:complete